MDSDIFDISSIDASDNSSSPRLQIDCSFSKSDDLSSLIEEIDNNEYEVALEEVYVKVDDDDDYKDNFNIESCLEVSCDNIPISNQVDREENIENNLSAGFDSKILIKAEDVSDLSVAAVKPGMFPQVEQKIFCKEEASCSRLSSLSDSFQNPCLNLNTEPVIASQETISTTESGTNVATEKDSLLVDQCYVETETILKNLKNDQSVTNNISTVKCMEENAEDTKKQEKVAEMILKKFLKYEPPPSTLGPLPEGWSLINHSSGVPCYYHKLSKVVTWSRPYTFGDFKHIKKHEVPLQSIPCLNYQRLKEKAQSLCPVQTQSQDDDVTKKDEVRKDDDNRDHTSDQTAENVIPPQLPKAMLHNSEQTLDLKEFEAYLEKRFIFYTREVERGMRWAEKRKLAAQKKREAQEEENNSSSGSFGKVVTVTIPKAGSDGRVQKMSFNLSIKPMIGIVHEYVQMTMKTKPLYQFTVKENSVDPFHVELQIEGKTYGRGSGASKKTAKNRAALEAMDTLVPGFRNKVNKLSEKELSTHFDNIAVNDPRVYELCLHVGDFLPYELLSECLKRNQPIVNVQDSFEATPMKGKTVEYTMRCGKHCVKGTAKNKKEGKQHASQRMLQLLHPQVKTWGELARRYGSEVSNKLKRKKELEQEILELKQKDASERSTTSAETLLKPSGDAESARDNSRHCDRRRDVLVANPELLDKLRNMMLQLREEKPRRASKSRKRKISSDGDGKKNKLLLIDV